MISNWQDLKYWNSGEWQYVQERLEDFKVAGQPVCPQRKDLFKSLSKTPFSSCKVAFIGQDPYPQQKYSTGLAFSIPKHEKTFPPALKTLFEEYQSDLHYPSPSCGDLTPWCSEGVLLWNVVPSCTAGRSLSHDWYEWSLLTNEILENLGGKGVVFVLLGYRARELSKLVTPWDNCRVIETGHPSPLGRINKNAKVPFLGSRIFTRVNDALTDIGHDPVDWRLPCEKGTSEG